MSERMKSHLEELLSKIDAMIPEQLEANEVQHQEQVKQFDADERKARLEAMKNKLRASGVPERYIDADFYTFKSETPEQAQVYDKIIDYYEEIHEGATSSLIIFGAVGTGKTWIGCMLVSGMTSDWTTAKIITAKKYSGKIRESYREGSKQSESQIMEEFGKVDLLVLDEVGRQFDTEAEKLYLFDLIDERYRNKKPTVFLSNLDKEALENFVGPAVFDRMKSDGGRAYRLDWPSRRT